MRNLKTPSNRNTPLRNARREKFAQAMARGLPAPQAYMEAGYRAAGHGAEVNGSRLRKNIEVAARVDELRRDMVERVVEKSGIAVADVLARLETIAFADMSLAASERLQWEVKRKALVDIGKHLGGFVARKEIGGPRQFAWMSDEELRQRVLEDARRICAEDEELRLPNEAEHLENAFPKSKTRLSRFVPSLIGQFWNLLARKLSRLWISRSTKLVGVG